MLFLASVVAGDGGIPVVNRMILAALAESRRTTALVSLMDAPDLPGVDAPADATGAGGSRWRFLRAALARGSAARRGPVLATHCGLLPVARLAGGGPLLVFLHGVEAWGPLPFRTRWGFRRVRRIVANSTWTMDRFREAHPSLAHIEGTVLPLPARPLPAPESGTCVPAPGGPRVLTVGRMQGRGMRKGQDALLRCWSRVRAVHSGAELVIVGDGEGVTVLRALARERGVEPWVRWPGSVSDAELDAWYRSSDVFAMPSEGEGFGLVFAEAMARGLPCIAGSRDAGGETVRHGVTGLVVDPRDDDAIGGALLALLGDRALRRTMGEAGRERVRERFSPEAFRDGLIRILDGAGTGP